MIDQTQRFTAYGVGCGNAPEPYFVGLGHLWAVFLFLKIQSYDTHVERSQTCDPCARI